MRLHNLRHAVLKQWWSYSSNTRRRLRQLSIAFVVIVSAVLMIIWTNQVLLEWNKNEPNILKLNWLVLAFIGQLLVSSLVLSRQKKLPWLLKWFSNLNSEFAGAFILSALLLVLVSMPEQRSVERELKQRLIRELRSPNNGIALLACDELADRGWLYDGTLKRAVLRSANLQEARLFSANLEGANLSFANLQGAHLEWANLQGVNLFYANLQETPLEWINLQGANLYVANLEGAHLSFANLQGANLSNANLRGASLGGALFDEETVLPDAEFNDGTQEWTSMWTPNTDMNRFTNPDHPNFWRPEPGSVWWYPKDN